jgi:hypothetical protein
VRSPVEPNNLHEAKNKAVQVSEVEALLDTYCTRIAEPTKYIAGFRTMDGKEIALEREGSGITLWTQYVSVDGAEIQPVRRYADTDTRNSNLNRKNCPALRLGNRALVWKLVDRDELLDFINWYGGVQLVA